MRIQPKYVSHGKKKYRPTWCPFQVIQPKFTLLSVLLKIVLENSAKIRRIRRTSMKQIRAKHNICCGKKKHVKCTAKTDGNNVSSKVKYKIIQNFFIIRILCKLNNFSRNDITKQFDVSAEYNKKIIINHVKNEAYLINTAVYNLALNDTEVHRIGFQPLFYLKLFVSFLMVIEDSV